MNVFSSKTMMRAGESEPSFHFRVLVTAWEVCNLTHRRISKSTSFTNVLHRGVVCESLVEAEAADSQCLQGGPLSSTDPNTTISDNGKLGLDISSVAVSRPLSVVSATESSTSITPATGHPNGAATFASYSFYPPFQSQTSFTLAL